MNRGYKNPVEDEGLLGVNPFASSLVIPVNKKMKKVLNKFKQEDEEEHILEATKFVKVFDVSMNRANVNCLPLRCKELWLYIIHSMESGKDWIWIDRHSYMENMGIRSVNTFKKAIAVLGVDNGYIQKHGKLKDVYWINPIYLFKGNRIQKFPKNIRL